MMFLEALNWMSEKKSNTAISGEYTYRVRDNKLQVYSVSQIAWMDANSNIADLMSRTWYESQVSEPAPEEVEVVAFVDDGGEVRFAIEKSEDGEDLRDSGWRKVKVRF